MDNAVLSVSSLRKTFHVGFWRKKVEAVRGVGFEVRPGEIFGLLGPNGAGKTTTLKMLMGLIFADGGTATIFGTPIGNPKSRERVGYLPESPYFHEYLNPLELLMFYGRLKGLSGRELRTTSRALVERVGLAEAMNRPLKKFSKGMLQRVGLAQALLGDSELLVLDEPMSGLDPLGRKFVADLMLELNEQGKTILFSSHILSDVERLCHRVAILNHGVRVAEGSLKDLLQSEDGHVESLESVFVRKSMLLDDQKG